MQWLEPRPTRRVPIRLTPLIDVVFILLLFFMLTSRMDPVGLLQLDTPAPEGGSEASEETPARLHLTEKGPEWNGEALEKATLEERIRAYDGERIQITTDDDAVLGDFAHWLGLVDDEGIRASWERDADKPGKTP